MPIFAPNVNATDLIGCIHITCQCIDDEGIDQMLEYIIQNPTIHSLVLCGSYSIYGLKRLDVHQIRQIRLIDLEDIDLSLCQVISDFLVSTPTLRSMTIHNAGLDDQMGIMLAQAVARSQSLQCLDLRYNRISPSGLEQIRQIRQRPTGLSVELKTVLLLGMSSQFGVNSPLRLFSPDTLRLVQSYVSNPGCFVIRHDQFSN
jgi:Ran GTPase-activating protein (RanGAP) involved in mRNA processing and transport